MNDNNEIKQKGHIDQIKSSECTRILSTNAKGLDPSHNIKIERFVESFEKFQIDLMLMNKANVKWTPANIDMIERRMKRLECDTVM